MSHQLHAFDGEQSLDKQGVLYLHLVTKARASLITDAAKQALYKRCWSKPEWWTEINLQPDASMSPLKAACWYNTWCFQSEGVIVIRGEKTSDSEALLQQKRL